MKELESTKTAKSNLTVELAAANNASSEVHKQVEQIAIENQQLFERLRDTESALVNGQASRRSHEGKVCCILTLCCFPALELSKSISIFDVQSGSWH